MYKILLVDDDEELAELIAEYLSAENYQITVAGDGASGLEKGLSGKFDLLILDVMLPKMNGFDVLKNLREKSDVPVLMLTARGEDAERILGLESGADDYLPKPFNPRELLARISAILRRTQVSEKEENRDSTKFRTGDIEINTAARTAKKDAELLPLTSLEFDLLVALLRDAGNVVNKEDLSQKVLGRRLSPFDRSLDMHISNLRKKLGTHSDGNERIKTIRSVGYIYTLNI